MKFLKRIATHEQSFLVADFESEFPKYWLGIPEQQNPKVKELKDTKENVLREVLETKYEVSKYEYEVLLYEYFKIGDKIKINNDTLTITKCVVKLKDGILQFNYKIENLNYLKTKLLENRKIQGVSLVGTILDVALNQVKIHLDIDDNQDQDTAHWFPYSAEANNVWYTMPHIGENIRIYFPTMRAAEAITMSSTRGSSGEIATNKTLNKPTEKYLDTKWGKQVALKESNVNVNTPLMSMVLDEENITLDSNQNIEITANEVLNVGKSVFTYTDSNGAVQTKIEETQSITIETEELCTVSVTSFSTVIELDEDNFMMPQDKVKMEGSVKDGFADMGSPGQNGGTQAQQNIDAVAPEPEIVEEEPPKKKKGLLGGLLTVGAVVVAAACACVAVVAAPAIGVVATVVICVAVCTTATAIVSAEVQEMATGDNWIADNIGRENYDTLVAGYFWVTSFLSVGYSSIPMAMKQLILVDAPVIAMGVSNFIDGKNDNDWRDDIQVASMATGIAEGLYALSRIPSAIVKAANNGNKVAIKVVDKADEVVRTVSKATDTIVDYGRNILNNLDNGNPKFALAGDGYLDDTVRYMDKSDDLYKGVQETSNGGASSISGGNNLNNNTVDDIIKNIPETTNGKGVARNFEKTGGFSETLKDFDSLNPSDVKEITTQYGTGKVGKLSDGTTVIARPGSATGGATLEIKVSNSKVYKIRY